MQQIRSPGVQHGEETDFSAQMLWIGCDDSQGLGRGTKKDAVDHLLVLVGDGRDLLRHGEDNVKVGNLQKFGLAVLDPLRSRQRLTFWAMPIPTRVELLLRGHRRAMLVAIGLPVAAEHIRHFQLGKVHNPELRSAEEERAADQRGGGAGEGRVDWRSSTPCWWRSAGNER